MTSRRLLRTGLTLSFVGLVGCNGVEVLPFPAGQGQMKVAPTYPSGPYGVTKGHVIEDTALTGFIAPQMNSDASMLQPISLADFYNPGGTETYPAGSPYGGGSPKPKALLIDIGATWCSPCQLEAKTTLPPKYAMYHPLGGEFLFVLADGPVQGVPAMGSELTNWVTKFNTTYPSVLDANRALSSAFSTAYPVNILIDTRTMTIVDVESGLLQENDPFFDELAATLAN